MSELNMILYSMVFLECILYMTLDTSENTEKQQF